MTSIGEHPERLAGSTASVLIVDDDPDIAETLRDLLEFEGYRVQSAFTGGAAIGAVEQAPFSAVILDLGLPDMDGLMVMQELCTRDPHLPVIILTAYTKEASTLESIGRGAFAYLPKPYNRDELRATLRRAVGVQALAVKAERTERAERALTDSEERFRSVVESASDAIVLADQRGIIHSWNTAAQHLFHYLPAEAIGQPLTMIMPERYREAHQKGIERAAAQGPGRLLGSTVELHGLRKDGSEFPLELSLGAWRTVDGQFYTGIIRDITARRQAEDSLARLRRLYELILNEAGEGIYGLDAVGRTTFVNPAGACMLGYSTDELTGRSMHALLHHSTPDGRPYPETACPIYAALRDGTVQRVSNEVFWRKNGSAFPVEYVSTPIQENGKLVGAVVVFRDITERRRTEEALEARREIFRQLAENIREVFWLSNPQKDEIIYISPGYEQIWGRSCESLYRSPRSWLDAIHPADLPRVLDAATTRQVQGLYDEEYRILRPDGTVRRIRDRAFPIRDPQGFVYRIAGIAEDITDRA